MFLPQSYGLGFDPSPFAPKQGQTQARLARLARLQLVTSKSSRSLALLRSLAHTRGKSDAVLGLRGSAAPRRSALVGVDQPAMMGVDQRGEKNGD